MQGKGHRGDREHNGPGFLNSHGGLLSMACNNFVHVVCQLAFSNEKGLPHMI